jgi:Ca2+-binding RTX toxin-like protein
MYTSNVETLESRRLLAVPSGNPLIINGTSALDVILLSQSGDTINVTVNGVTRSYNGGVGYIGTTPGTGTPYTIPRIIVYGYAGNDFILADNSVNKPLTIYGGPGSDNIRGGGLSDDVYGGSNSYLQTNESGQDTLDGGNGNDRLFASWSRGNYLRGRAGNDTLTGGQAHDTLYGDEGNDSLVGNEGNDRLGGGYGNDRLDGGKHIDVLDGGWGRDWLDGGPGDDEVYGSSGNDTLMASPGADLFKGGGNWDIVDYTSYIADLIVTQDMSGNDGAYSEGDNVWSDIECILGGVGDDLIVGGSLDQWIDGHAGNDTLRGSWGDDTILGGSGDDEIHGDAGYDWLYGEASSDTLYGGADPDYMEGGSARDTLIGVGGSSQDTLFGGSDIDSFWMDDAPGEIHDASTAEWNSRRVHRIGLFGGGVSKELNGQNLPDPFVSDIDDFEYPSNQTQYDANPLFGSTGNPSRDDINQGLLGDCYFLATLSAVADKQPELLRESIVELGDGTYAVMFYENGSSRYYRVDNDLPAKVGENSAAYAQPGMNGAIWVPLMEKAYAMHEGDWWYFQIEGGWAEDALDDLGIANTEIDVDDDNVLQTIANHLAAGNPVTIDTIYGEFETGDSLVASHVYTVTSVDVSAGTITLRNPWGSDAGRKQGSFVQGANDGYITFTWDQAFRDATEDFTVGLM